MTPRVQQPNGRGGATPGQSSHSVITESLADALMAELARRRIGGPAGGWGHYAGVQGAGLAAAYDVEVAALLRSSPWLRQAVRAACRVDGQGRPLPGGRAQLMNRLEHELGNHQSHVRLSLEALLGADGRGFVADQAAADNPALVRRQERPRPQRTLAALTRHLRGTEVGRVVVPLLLLNGIIAAVLVTGPVLHWVFGTTLPSRDERVLALSAATVWALSFIPGWLFVRFLDRRAGALWDEYVIHLHRLGLDDPGNLPEPPRTSSYHDAWAEDGGVGRMWLRNVYREKFDAYYGRSVSRFGTDLDRPVKPEALFPVFLCTGLLAVGWTAIFYDPRATLGTSSPPTVWTVLSFAFAGAYLFFMQMLMRRYFQADMRAGAYVSGYVRVVGALLVVAVLYAALLQKAPAGLAIAVAFAVGWFPNVGLQWLLRIASRRLRGAVPSVEAAYPLNRLDGLNVWYEARLLEEGIEDLQNLMTAKIVDVLLHTRVPVARLVDWVDQALLLIHLPPEPAALDQEGRSHKQRSLAATKLGAGHRRHVLREVGVRSATSLLRALHRDRDPAAREELVALLETRGFPRAAVWSLHDLLAADRRLGVVYNWQGGDARPRTPLPLTPLP